jgi:hypothetical protein
VPTLRYSIEQRLNLTTEAQSTKSLAGESILRDLCVSVVRNFKNKT